MPKHGVVFVLQNSFRSYSADGVVNHERKVGQTDKSHTV